jgi:hypothetical protein
MEKHRAIRKLKRRKHPNFNLPVGKKRNLFELPQMRKRRPLTKRKINQSPNSLKMRRLLLKAVIARRLQRLSPSLIKTNHWQKKRINREQNKLKKPL